MEELLEGLLGNPMSESRQGGLWFERTLLRTLDGASGTCDRGMLWVRCLGLEVEVSCLACEAVCSDPFLSHSTLVTTTDWLLNLWWSSLFVLSFCLVSLRGCSAPTLAVFSESPAKALETFTLEVRAQVPKAASFHGTDQRGRALIPSKPTFCFLCFPRLCFPLFWAEARNQALLDQSDNRPGLWRLPRLCKGSGLDDLMDFKLWPRFRLAAIKSKKKKQQREKKARRQEAPAKHGECWRPSLNLRSQEACEYDQAQGFQFS